ncbi:MAG TPA: AbrB/MazE/SpoVT family DNA-binding domain-containing protein [Candidatus Nanoarchaeia archaeon]|nr:AbrB/MazE/SpoVT family DNA-binding domain-containing protein [Candidatus Nanoarchaeia archaeon]
MVGIKTSIGEKGQVVIPKQLRDEFNLVPGETVEFDKEDDRITIKRAPKKDSTKIFIEIKEMIKKKGGFSKEDYKKINWSKLYEEEIEERTIKR